MEAYQKFAEPQGTDEFIDYIIGILPLKYPMNAQPDGLVLFTDKQYSESGSRFYYSLPLLHSLNLTMNDVFFC